MLDAARRGSDGAGQTRARRQLDAGGAEADAIAAGEATTSRPAPRSLAAHDREGGADRAGRRRARPGRARAPVRGLDRERRWPTIEPVDFYTPSALVLLLQHLALTFAALSLVRDRELGLFELLRVGPLSSCEIVAGKTIAYLIVGLVSAWSLMAAAVLRARRPVRWAASAGCRRLGLVLLASLALGTLISLISRTETQAVQWSMLTLLAGLFFSGFILSLDGLTYPVRRSAWLLPVTYGIRMLQDVMFRGHRPATPRSARAAS